MGYHVSSLDELGEGYGFRKIRTALGVTAFGANALVLAPGYVGPEHYHHHQDELYFVHRGTATFTIADQEHEGGAGGVVHVESTTPSTGLISQPHHPTATRAASSHAKRSARLSALTTRTGSARAACPAAGRATSRRTPAAWRPDRRGSASWAFPR